MNKKGNMNKGLSLVILFGIIAAVLTVLGILGQSLRDSQTAGDASYVIADWGLNGTVNTANQMTTVGSIVGVFLIVAVAVVMILLLIMLVKKVGGGKKRSRSYYR